MFKWAIETVKDNEKKIIGTYNSKEEAMEAGEAYNKTITERGVLLSCIYTEFDEKDNVISNKYKLYHVWGL